eukprot:15486944-Heterocapsa_arctica.AAC.1
MVSAGIEELCQEVYFGKKYRQDGSNMPSIARSTLTNPITQSRKAPSVPRGLTFLLEGWQPIEPGNELHEQADPTLSQTFLLKEGVIVENRRAVGDLVAGSYAP